jgi:hypothetical protein
MEHLYRIYDEADRILYIGISNQWRERLHSHEKASPWMTEAVTIRLEKYPNRKAVEAAEREAIRLERPLYNKRFSLDFESKNAHFQKLKFWMLNDVDVDATHEDLVSMGRHAYARIGAKRAKSKYAALAFHIAYASQPSHSCRNCQALIEDTQVRRWAVMALNDTKEGI